MKLIFKIAFALSSIWLIVNIQNALVNFANITQLENSGFYIGAIIGTFFYLTLPLGLVMAFYRYSNKKQKETKNALH